ncbi:thiamine phosphate synthase [Serratia marcescens]|uniref:Thiamine phosphate synthase n=1 Tax=Serratia marcescens TaxID=615 RepID=A0A939NQJ2_SERMA|nr:thiamine phosphate synthase [Serratia marcescens]
MEWIARLLEAGVTTIQLRIKDLPDEQVERGHRCRHRAGPALSSATVHQRLLAAGDQHGAYGVHLGQKISIPPIWRPFTAPGCGSACPPMTTRELARALAVKPSYIALGHIFPTQTKDMPSAPQADGVETPSPARRITRRWRSAGSDRSRAGGAGVRRRQRGGGQRHHPRRTGVRRRPSCCG